MRCLGAAVSVLGFLTLTSQAASAQTTAPTLPVSATPTSAQDKGAARLVATQGIDLYRAGKFQQALERMNKAEELFDAPVHLLYIARCQRELGQWVEAAETYRRLSRTTLAADAPPVFSNAVADGAKEMTELEPRIPRVLVAVTPAAPPGLHLELNGQVVPSAAVGVERPQNPGHIEIKARATGFADFTAQHDVVEGQVTHVDIALEPVKAAPVASPPAKTEGAKKTPAPAKDKPSGTGLLLGLRLGLAVPAGSFAGVVVHPGMDDANAKFGSFAKTGLELELRLGIHLINRLGAVLFISRDGFANKDDASFEHDLGGGLAGGVVTKPRTPMIDSFGVLVLLGAPRGTSGPFGELGLAMVHSLAYDTTVARSTAVLAANDCSGKVNTTGTALRLGTGWNFPISDRLFSVMPYLNWTLGGADSVQYTPGDACSDLINESKHEIKDGPIHSVLSFGVGGDFIFGG